MNEASKAAALSHALQVLPREACGLVVVVKGRERYIPCRNLSIEPREMFVLDPDDYAAAEDLGEITAVFHSHPKTSPAPSEADRTACEASGLAWHICSPRLGTWAELAPCGYKAPLIGRQYAWAIADCWTLVRDWYIENGVMLPDWQRPVSSADFVATPMFEDCWASAGFTPLPEEEPLQRGDALLMRIAGKGLDHVGVYIGDGLILHHLQGRLSSRDIYGGWLQSCTGKTLRHYDWAKLQSITP
jgi:proteasome lid subunit RPN8/RPN11